MLRVLQRKSKLVASGGSSEVSLLGVGGATKIRHNKKALSVEGQPSRPTVYHVTLGPVGERQATSLDAQDWGWLLQ